MIWRLKIGTWRFTLSFAQVTDVVGVNSKLSDGNHLLMWDFDDVPLYKIKRELGKVRSIYDLPKIYLFNTGAPRHWMAYCFKRVTWRLWKEIVAFTKHVDPQYYKFSVYRDHGTLRVSQKCGREIKRKLVIPSPQPNDVTMDELESWVKYETLTDLSPEGIKELVVI
ncbi:unnamed protein product [marine sediment metagenome]|uniref:Uncharacterized protein n=1 Tax=marine sediment metagenome TaxID=412755 RepID=X1SJ77_9ZZZZ